MKPPFSPRQDEFYFGSTAFLNICDGAVRSGKTYASLWRLVVHALDGPRGDMMIVGKTERTAERNVISPLREMFGGRVRYLRGVGQLRIGDRLLHVVGANDTRADEKIRGATLAGAYCNELSLFPQPVFQTLIDRCSVDGSRIFADTNPDSPFHWLNRDYLTNEDLLDRDLRRFHFALDDNPALSEEYKERLKRLHSGVWYDRMVLGRWVVAEGAVYDMFEPESHSMVPHIVPVDFERVVVGVDYGTSNRTVFLKAGLSKGTWYVFDEYVYDARESGRQKTDEEYATDFVEWLAPHSPETIEVDPSAASFKAALKRAGVPNVEDADNDVLDGIRDVASALNTGALKIARHCSNTVESLAVYAWDPKAQQRGEDKPLKVNDHEADACRYLCRRLFKPRARRSVRLRR